MLDLLFLVPVLFLPCIIEITIRHIRVSFLGGF